MNDDTPISNFMKGMAVLVDDDDSIAEVLAVIAPDDVLLVCADKAGQVHLVDIDYVKDGSYELFRDRAAAEAYVARKQAKEKAEAA